jgi:large subunit ribosomal protein L10
MVTTKKISQVENLINLLSNAQAIYFADLSKIDAITISQLRMQCKNQNVKVKVVKNRLCKLALERVNIQGLDQFLIGPTALFLTYDDPLTPIKLIKEFRKKNAQLLFKGAYIDGSLVTSEQFDYLSKIPSKSELLNHMVFTVQQPLAELIYVLETPFLMLSAGLEEIKNKKNTAGLE